LREALAFGDPELNLEIKMVACCYRLQVSAGQMFREGGILLVETQQGNLWHLSESHLFLS